MLRIDVRGLRQGSIPTEGELAPGDPAFQGLELEFAGPVWVTGVLQPSGRGTFRWQGKVRGQVRGNCRRCLADLVTGFDTASQAVYSTDPSVAEDPGVFRLTEPVAVIDLTQAIREEVGLSVEAYPLCREDCAGLCPGCGSDLNQGPCECRRSRESV